MGTGSFPWVQSSRGVTLTLHPLVVLWSWKGRAIALLPLWAIWPVQSLTACTRGHFTFFTIIVCTCIGSSFGVISLQSDRPFCVCVRAHMRHSHMYTSDMLPQHRCMHLCVLKCSCWYSGVPLIWHPWDHTCDGLLDVPDYWTVPILT